MSHTEMIVFVCSDAVGETADAVARATLRQFSNQNVKIKRFSNIRDEDEIQAIVEEATKNQVFIVYTLVLPELREMMKKETARKNVRSVDIMGPMMQAYIDTFNDSPKRAAGLLHTLDEDYYRRVDAVEFAVKCDDGKDTNGLLHANIVLIGISRTSKTPLSIYMAYKGLKVANFPLVPEVKPPAELFKLPPQKIFGLVIDPHKMLKIREIRLQSAGLPPNAKYASLQRISEELEFAADIMRQLRCPVIDVTDKAIEETAEYIISRYLEGREQHGA
ncbi:MAG TPA: pyruvate, water dikinase regulatory protein [Bacilli bacterium]